MRTVRSSFSCAAGWAEILGVNRCPTRNAFLSNILSVGSGEELAVMDLVRSASCVVVKERCLTGNHGKSISFRVLNHHKSEH